MILHDDIAAHRKFLLAGHLIGGQGAAARALAVYVAAIGYAREFLTDGYVDDAFFVKFPLDSCAKKVARAMSSKGVRLFHRVRGGYLVHDFHDGNAKAEKLKYDRQLARDRKRRQRERDAVKAALKAQTPAPDLLETVTRDMPRDSEKEKEKEVRTSDNEASIGDPDPSIDCVVPTKEQRADARNSLEFDELSKGKRDELTRTPAPDGNYAVLVRLTHAVMDEEGDGDPTSPDLIEAVKSRAAQARIKYPPDVLHNAMRFAATQRVRGGSSSPAPLATLVGRVRDAVATGTLPATVRELSEKRR